jgi:hypothetical protein
MTMKRSVLVDLRTEINRVFMQSRNSNLDSTVAFAAPRNKFY